MKTSASLLALLFSLFLFCLPAHAADPFVRFVEDTRSFSADFTLQTEGANGKRTLSVGRLDVQKPGKFRWQIEQPAPQLMVCDGTTLWFYDQDLNQASRRPAREALPGTPAAFLAGDASALQRFTLSDAGQAEGLHWTKAAPKDADSGFAALEAGFDAQGQLQALRFADAFGQRALLRLQRQTRNPALPATRFTFTPPPGTDVLASPGE